MAAVRTEIGTVVGHMKGTEIVCCPTVLGWESWGVRCGASACVLVVVLCGGVFCDRSRC